MGVSHAVAVLTLIAVLSSATGQTPQVTRTALHVARSLDPDDTETMTVRTRTGDVATLVVKRRDGRHRSDLTPPDVQNLDTPGSPASQPSGEQDRRKAKANANVPAPVYIRSSPVLVKGEQNDPWKRARSLMEVDSDGIPVITGVRVPDDDSDRQTWRNARVINGELVPYDKSQPKHNSDLPKEESEKEKQKVFGQSGIEWLKMEPVPQSPVEITDRTPGSVSETGDSWQRMPTRDDTVLPGDWQVVNQGEEFRPAQVPMEARLPWQFHRQDQLSEQDRRVRDRILDYIKSVNQQELMGRQQIYDRDGRALKTDQIQARVLHAPGSTVYPISLLYSPPSSQPSRVSFEEGVRTPVLQYAHPELGVQPAKVVSRHETEQLEIDENDSGREQALSYFAHDIHADRSPYAFEPGLEEEARVEDKRSHSGGIAQRPKKTLSYFYPDQSVADSYNDKYYKYGSKEHAGYKYTTARPFWARLGDSMWEHVQTGMDRMSDLTRPVVEPLVEATHKISANLGLANGNRELKEKLGVAESSSVLLPAIGLVAGGAALGLGAVAVGRYLDVDMLKRSGTEVVFDDVQLLEHKRALEAISSAPSGSSVPYVSSAPSSSSAPQQKEGSRTKRSADDVTPDRFLEDMLQNVDAGPAPRPLEGLHPGLWGSTPCAKRVFCDVVAAQGEDAILLMEKKMATYLSMIHPSIAEAVGYHLDDVMGAVKRRNCRVFQCISSRRQNMEIPVPR